MTKRELCWIIILTFISICLIAVSLALVINQIHIQVAVPMVIAGPSLLLVVIYYLVIRVENVIGVCDEPYW